MVIRSAITFDNPVIRFYEIVTFVVIIIFVLVKDWPINDAVILNLRIGRKRSRQQYCEKNFI